MILFAEILSSTFVLSILKIRSFKSAEIYGQQLKSGFFVSETQNISRHDFPTKGNLPEIIL